MHATPHVNERVHEWCTDQRTNEQTGVQRFVFPGPHGSLLATHLLGVARHLPIADECQACCMSTEQATQRGSEPLSCCVPPGTRLPHSPQFTPALLPGGLASASALISPLPQHLTKPPSGTLSFLCATLTLISHFLLAQVFAECQLCKGKSQLSPCASLTGAQPEPGTQGKTLDKWLLSV